MFTDKDTDCFVTVTIGRIPNYSVISKPLFMFTAVFGLVNKICTL